MNIENEVRKQGMQIGSLQEMLQKAAQHQLEKQQAEQQEKFQKFVIELTSKHYEKAQAYTNVIIIAGYAGAFTIWSSTKQALTLPANITIALLLGFSLLIFVLHEIYGMIARAKAINNNRKLLAIATPEEFFKEAAKLKEREDKQVIAAFWVWTVALVLTVVPALLAIGLLFYNYMAIIASWPLWPK